MTDPSGESGGRFITIKFYEANQKVFWGTVESSSPAPVAGIAIDGSGVSIPVMRFLTNADTESSIAFARDDGRGGVDQWVFRIAGSRLIITDSGVDVLSLGTIPEVVSGSKSTGAALTSLLAALVNLGLIVDSTTA